MIYRKRWTAGKGNTLRVWEGWFLFLIIPLYVVKLHDAGLDQ